MGKDEDHLIIAAMNAAATQFSGMKDARGVPVDPSTVTAFAGLYLDWMRQRASERDNAKED